MRKLKENQDIIILQLPIDIGNEVAFSMSMDDRLLIDAICRYSDGLRKNEVEVWERKNNVIATEKGFFFSMYESDVALVESGQFKPE